MAAGLFAQVSADVEFNQKGQSNLTVVAGFNGWGLSAGAGFEPIMGSLNMIDGFPMEWGIAVRVQGAFYLLAGYDGFDYGAAPLVTLHKGFTFGDGLDFDFMIGAGLGLYGYSYGYAGLNYSTPLPSVSPPSIRFPGS